MSKVSKNEVEKAAREYVEALNIYNKLVNESVSVFGLGETSFEPKVLTREKLNELREANIKLNEAHKKWRNLILSYTEAKSKLPSGERDKG